MEKNGEEWIRMDTSGEEWRRMSSTVEASLTYTFGLLSACTLSASCTLQMTFWFAAVGAASSFYVLGGGVAERFSVS